MPELKAEDFIKNPLLSSDFIVKARTIKDGSFVKDGEVILPKEIQVEQSPLAKIFTDKENRLTVALLSPRAQRLFLWILFEIEPGKDFIWINVKRYMKENRIEDRKTYRTAVTELSRYMMIFKHPNYKTVFWFNPRYFFAGSRVSKYPDNIKYINDEPEVKTQPQIAVPEVIVEPPSEYKIS